MFSGVGVLAWTLIGAYMFATCALGVALGVWLHREQMRDYDE